MVIDWLASRGHYLEHLDPIRDELDTAGQLFVGPEAHDAIALLDDGTPTVVAAMRDAVMVPESRPVCLVEHGAGQTYEGLHSDGYAGGGGRERVSLFLCPSERVADLNRAAYPTAQVEVVGCAKLDHPPARAPRGERPIVALTWHWRCNVAVETRPALDHYRDAVRRLAATGRYELLGHAHPRLWDDGDPPNELYDELGIEWTRSWPEVLARADLLCFDNTSAGYEAAALGIPVLALDSPEWRDEPRHGLRFYDSVPGLRLRARMSQAPECEPVFQWWGEHNLEAAIAEALADADGLRAKRELVSDEVYGPRDGRASERAAEILRRWT